MNIPVIFVDTTDSMELLKLIARLAKLQTDSVYTLRKIHPAWDESSDAIILFFTLHRESMNE